MRNNAFYITSGNVSQPPCNSGPNRRRHWQLQKAGFILTSKAHSYLIALSKFHRRRQRRCCLVPATFQIEDITKTRKGTIAHSDIERGTLIPPLLIFHDKWNDQLQSSNYCEIATYSNQRATACIFSFQNSYPNLIFWAREGWVSLLLSQPQKLWHSDIPLPTRLNLTKMYFTSCINFVDLWNGVAFGLVDSVHLLSGHPTIATLVQSHNNHWYWAGPQYGPIAARNSRYTALLSGIPGGWCWLNGWKYCLFVPHAHTAGKSPHWARCWWKKTRWRWDCWGWCLTCWNWKYISLYTDNWNTGSLELG